MMYQTALDSFCGKPPEGLQARAVVGHDGGGAVWDTVDVTLTEESWRAITAAVKERVTWLSQYAFLSSYTMRTDAEEAEVHDLKAKLEAVGIDPGWPVVPRSKEQS